MTRFLMAILVLTALPALADPAQVVGVDFGRDGEAWRVEVTIRHGDTGWDDYADGWRVETENGAVLGTRVLHHPHVEEQPFTRSLGGVSLPEGTGEVFVRTRTSTTGWAETVWGPFAIP